MSKFDDQYIDLCRRILSNGEKITNYQKTDSRSKSTQSAIPDHTAQGKSSASTIRLPHQVLQFDLSEEFPILTSKKVGFKTAILEILWIYQAASNDVRWLQNRDVKIWNEWEIAEDGTYQGRNINQIFAKNHPEEPATDFAHTIGTAYGWIVNRYGLIQNLIDTLKHNPGNRRMVLSLWQNEWLETAALPSCVWNSQWNLIDGKLNLLVTSRSSDVPLGLPFNVVQYATLCYLIAQVVGAKPGQFTFITNDAHIYENQIDGIKEQIARYDKATKDGTLPPAPTIWLNPDIADFYDFDNSKELKDIRLENYENLGTIKMPVTE
ncbi:MAG: thymidylate synthase [Candidatus Saccharibacteria bacterium]|nr:thymidylate synthase [Candidatus Saccharibacteria bacterium]